jgi:hypothetical protein
VNRSHQTDVLSAGFICLKIRTVGETTHEGRSHIPPLQAYHHRAMRSSSHTKYISNGNTGMTFTKKPIKNKTASTMEMNRNQNRPIPHISQPTSSDKIFEKYGIVM